MQFPPSALGTEGRRWNKVPGLPTPPSSVLKIWTAPTAIVKITLRCTSKFKPSAIALGLSDLHLVGPNNGLRNIERSCSIRIILKSCLGHQHKHCDSSRALKKVHSPRAEAVSTPKIHLLPPSDDSPRDDLHPWMPKIVAKSSPDI